MEKRSLRALAKEIGVSASYLSQIKNGKRSPSPKLLNTLLNSVNFDEFDVGAYFSYNSTRNAGEWCSGSTGDFGSSDPGSNPGSPAIFMSFYARDS